MTRCANHSHVVFLNQFPSAPDSGPSEHESKPHQARPSRNVVRISKTMAHATTQNVYVGRSFLHATVLPLLSLDGVFFLLKLLLYSIITLCPCEIFYLNYVMSAPHRSTIKGIPNMKPTLVGPTLDWPLHYGGFTCHIDAPISGASH